MKKSILTAVMFLFIGMIANAQTLKQYTWESYKTKFKIGSSWEVKESTADYFSAGDFNINLTVSPQKDVSKNTSDLVKKGLQDWVKQNNVTVSSEGYTYLSSDMLNGYHGWMIDGYYNGDQQVFMMNVVDPDFTSINIYVWIAYNTKSYDMAMEVLKSFTPSF